MPAPTPGTPSVCESCGDVDVEVVAVRRLYVTPESWDQAGLVRIASDERWCFVCRTHYPHHELDHDGNAIDHELGWPLDHDGPAGGDAT